MGLGFRDNEEASPMDYRIQKRPARPAGLAYSFLDFMG